METGGPDSSSLIDELAAVPKEGMLKKDIEIAGRMIAPWRRMPSATAFILWLLAKMKWCRIYWLRPVCNRRYLLIPSLSAATRTAASTPAVTVSAPVTV